ncbi:ubiquitin-conjugating enzyme E2 [Guillardia theta CCMP2712]|uniref:Ubiquitin-conjugating enzyme E2 n=1 Tax=Guillardia theta (strain CCMP2712) TaxID=905079 RepID=L1I9P2_GUITC|nr:ubiquitin-conjugating enzyme E2 [Guillardia theta CCMP2712]EKX32575.1 ubiquitin-conjugating enzyme E2 [Guillardia theta CCMP2712]|eukprot:XP_005819555.1 ubiquitin-conjugating enzyme E2 [Guillardia theta CCMP2712]
MQSSSGSNPSQVAARNCRRLQRELADLITGGIFHVEEGAAGSTRWVVKIRGAEGTFYHGEVFRLQFVFPPEYPIEAPEVVFLHPAPIHPHIYSNGHICLSILYDGGWSPALKVESVCLSILSMLSSAEAKRPPEDNDNYVRTCSSSPKKTRWVFHDNKA